MSFWKFLGNMAVFSAIYKLINRHRGGQVNPAVAEITVVAVYATIRNRCACSPRFRISGRVWTA